MRDDFPSVDGRLRRWELLAEASRSDQVPHEDVGAIMRGEPEFEAWYLARYTITSEPSRGPHVREDARAGLKADLDKMGVRT